MGSHVPDTAVETRYPDEGLTSLEALHQELGRIAGVPIPEATLVAIMDDMPEWTHGTENTKHGIFRFLHRTLLDRSTLIELPETEQSGKAVIRDRKGIKIRTRDITGADLQMALSIELQLDALEDIEEGNVHVLEAIPKPAPIDPEVARFQESTGRFLEEGDTFTDTESILLSHITHCDTQDKLGAAVGVSASSVSRIVKPVRERLGLESNVDLMLAVIAEGIADIDHVPQGMTAHLNKGDLALLRETYALDPDIRKQRRAKFDPSRWSRMYDKIEEALRLNGHVSPGVNRHWAVLYALKDSVIQHPSESDR